MKKGSDTGPKMPGACVAVLAPPGAQAAIEEAGAHLAAEFEPVSIDALCAGICEGRFACAVIDRDRIEGDAVSRLAEAAAAQPSPSDFSFLLLLDRADAGTLDAVAGSLMNVVLLERPVEPSLLRHAVRGVLRARTRQSDAADIQTQDLKTANLRLRQEIEERHAAEQRLREREELYRYTVELSRQFVWTAGPDGIIVPVSPLFGELTGLRETETGDEWLSTIHPDDRPGLLAQWMEIVARREPGSAEFRLRMADGSYRFHRAQAAPRFDEEGEVVRWYGFTEDVHEQRLAETARERAEERYRLAARATNDAIWDLDLEKNLIHWSDSSADALGYPGQVLGTTPLGWWSERVHPEDRLSASDSLTEAIETGKTRWSASYRFRQSDGEYATFYDRGFIMRDEDGRPLRAVGAMVDISERQRAESEIHRMQAELIHVSRLSAMGTMASTLAHEINQPLTAVTNYVRGSRRLLETGGTPKVADALTGLEAAEAGALRAGQIVRRLRELVARGAASVRPEELPKLIEDAGVLAFLDAHLLSVTPSIETDPDATWVEVDRIQIQQVLINLIRNAVQAMQQSTKREIAVTTRKLSPHFVEVAVADTGSGLSPEVRDALFSPFTGTKSEGLGIGLSISRTIIEAHGGKIWAEDREGGGTIFRFTLPLYDEEPVAGEPAP